MNLTDLRQPLDAIPAAAISTGAKRAVDSAVDVITTADALDKVTDAGRDASDRLAAAGSAAGAASGLAGRGTLIVVRRLGRTATRRPLVSLAVIGGLVAVIIYVRSRPGDDRSTPGSVSDTRSAT